MKVETIQITNQKIKNYPLEDSFLYHDNIYVIADGISRDIIECPSGAKIVSDIFCAQFLACLESKSTYIIENDIYEAFQAANEEIFKYNSYKIQNLDYLDHDYYGCVACGACLRGNKLYWGAIGDCGIAIYDKKNRLNFRTPNFKKTFDDYEPYLSIILSPLTWKDPQYRKIIREQYRNIYSGENVKHSFGAITGEKSAMNYVHTGTVSIQKSDIVLLYSDGISDLIFTQNNIDLIRNENIIEFKKIAKTFGQDDKTLIIIFI